MLGNLFKYENDMLFKINKRTKKWICYNEVKPNGSGYIVIQINNKKVLLHRLVYLFHNPSWNIHDSCHDNSIDHINGNKLDNKIGNLRIVNNSENQQNTTHCKGTPIKGVCFHKRDNTWLAQWYVNKKQKQKCFKTEEEAIEHRAKMVEIHYSHHPSKRLN